MEKGAFVGMMALAASDFLFCLVTISGTYLPVKMKLDRKDFEYFIKCADYLHKTVSPY